MTLLLSGTNGLSDVDGSASTPAIRGTDTNTGIFFPAADTIAFAEGGAEVARFDSSGRLGIGTTSPSQNLQVVSTTNSQGILVSGSVDNVALNLSNSGTSGKTWSVFSTNTNSGAGGGALAFFDGTAYRMILDSSGNLLVGTTSQFSSCFVGFQCDANTRTPLAIKSSASAPSSYLIRFVNNSGTDVGAVQMNATNNGVNFITLSDYRLKENVAPMVDALQKVQQLNPCTYTWKDGGFKSQGFIAHELQAVIPECVVGDKDAIETYTDEDGLEKTKPRYQGIDTSFLVATLTAAIQELKAELDTVKTELATLKGQA
jgi:hypothetical protein